MRRWIVLALLLAGGPLAADEPAGRVTVEVTPAAGTVGDRLATTVTVEVPAGTRFEPERIGPELGALSVVSGSWDGPVEVQGGLRWVWSGGVSAFETGSFEIPPVVLRIEGADGERVLESEPFPIEISSVLSEEDLASPDPELADLKPPASVPAQYGPLWTALGVLALLLIAAAVLWWLHRRYAARLAAVAVPEDPFRRLPPHVWVYAELQALLERRLPEQGQMALFFSEISRILKRYLGGRYRVDLLEQTTAEVPALLSQAGAPEVPVQVTTRVLELCDRVKFAKLMPDPEACRETVEQVYRIVDTSKPVESSEAEGAERGAA